jgi:WD40 repeat protein
MYIWTKMFWLVLAVLIGAANTLSAHGAAEEPILVIDPQGHSAMINEVMFTPDGHILISMSDDKTIRLWDVESGELLKTLRGQIGDGPEGKLYTGALSPDGRTLAMGGYLKNDEIRLINIETGEQTGLLQGHSNAIDALAFSQDGRWLASGSADDTVRIWDISKTITAGGKSAAFAELKGHTDEVYGAAFSPDSSKVVSASYDHTLRLWKKNSKGQFSSSNFIEMKKHTEEVYCVAWSPDGRYIVSGGFDDKILLWDGKGNFIKEIDELNGNVGTISFSSDSKRIVAMTKAGAVYAIPSGSKISSFTKHNNTVFASAFYGSDLIATAGGDDKDIYLWDANTGSVKKHLLGKGKSIWAAAFDEGLQVAFGQRQTPASLINEPLEKSFDFPKMTLDRETPLANRFTRTRTTYLGKTLKKVNKFELQVSEGLTIKNDRYTDRWIRCYTFTNDGKVVVGSDFSLKLYRNDGTLIRKFVGHTGVVWAVSVSRDGRILGSASGDQTIKLWNITAGQLLATLFVTTDNEWICWTPKGFYAASAGGEKYIGWHVNQGMDKAAEYYPVYSFRR